MLRDALAELIRLVAFKNEAIIHAIFVDDLLDSKNKVSSGGFSKRIYRSDPLKQRDQKVIIDWLEYGWFIYLHPGYKRLAGFLCALLSILLICL